LRGRPILRFRKRVIKSVIAKGVGRNLGVMVARRRSNVVFGYPIRPTRSPAIISQMSARSWHPTRVPFERIWIYTTCCIAFPFDEKKDQRNDNSNAQEAATDGARYDRNQNAV